MLGDCGVISRYFLYKEDCTGGPECGTHAAGGPAKQRREGWRGCLWIGVPVLLPAWSQEPVGIARGHLGTQHIRFGDALRSASHVPGRMGVPLGRSGTGWALAFGVGCGCTLAVAPSPSPPPAPLRALGAPGPHLAWWFHRWGVPLSLCSRSLQGVHTSPIQTEA